MAQEQQPVAQEEPQEVKQPVKTTAEILAQLGDLNGLSGTEIIGFGGGSQ